MRVLVTGCHGQVGRHLVRVLTQKKVKLLSLDRSQLDISDKNAVSEIVRSFSPDYIINAAAYTAVDKAEDEAELSFAINGDGPKFLAQAAESGGAVMIHISTDYVFSGEEQVPYKESDPIGPQSIYGKSKLAGELAVADVCTRHLIMRTSWVFNEHGHNFVKTMLRLGAERDSLCIVGDQFGGPTYAGDIAKALCAMVEFVENTGEAEWGIYHFSGAPHVSWYEFASEVFDHAKKAAVLEETPLLTAIPSSHFPTPAKRPSNSRLNCDKIARKFEIQPSDWLSALKDIKGYE